MGDVIDFLGVEYVRGEPDSPLYQVCFSKTQIFSSLKRTQFLLKFHGHEAALGEDVLELTSDRTYRKRSLREDEKAMIVVQPQAEK